jgi:hypothetical protein
MPRYANFWDSVSLHDVLASSSIHMFGNANIGYLSRSNLMCAGQFTPGGDMFVATNWYARVNYEPPLGYGDAFNRWLAASTATFIIADRMTWCLPLADLMLRRGPQLQCEVDDEVDAEAFVLPTLWPELLPPRHWASVRLDSFERYDIESMRGTDHERDMRFWIHIEGLRLYNRPEEGDDDNIDAIMAILQRQNRINKNAEQRIVDWLTGMVKEIEDPAAAAQVHAITDGILEGKHRS